MPKEGFPFHPVHVTGFDRRRPWTLVTALVHLSHEEHRLIEKFGSGEFPMPDVAIGFGAYLELPLMRAAAKLGIPIALHEQNSVPGLANKRTAKSARLIALGQPPPRTSCAPAPDVPPKWSLPAIPSARACSRATDLAAASRSASRRTPRSCWYSAAPRRAPCQRAPGLP